MTEQSLNGKPSPNGKAAGHDKASRPDSRAHPAPAGHRTIAENVVQPHDDCAQCGKIHERCKAHRKTDGEPCMLRPHPGARVCRKHGGSAPQVKAAANERVAVAAVKAEVLRLGSSLDIEPLQALLQQVSKSAGVVAWLEGSLKDLEPRKVTDAEAKEGGKGLIKGSAFGDYVDPVYKLWTEERRQLAKFAAMCVSAGVAERQVRLAEQQGALIADVIRKVLGDPELGLSPEQQRAGRAVAGRHLMVLGEVA